MNKKYFLESYYQFEKQLNKLTLFLVMAYFQTNNVNITDGVYKKEEIITLINIQKKYIKFLNYAFYALEEQNWIKISGDKISFSFLENISDEIKNLSLTLQKQYPDFVILVDFVKHCASYYKKVLTGEMLGVSIIYPSADVNFIKPVATLVEKIYDIDYQCRILKTIAKTTSKTEPLSVLEVGGGVGLITWKLIQYLNKGNVKYTFTDISRFFIANAKRKAKSENFNFMDFLTFDISQPPQSQGFKAESYDFILAVNVIHATPDISSTLHHLKYILKPGGKIFIVEHGILPTWSNLSWGILDGWWLFSDKYRELSPTIKMHDWQTILSDVGFSDIRTFVPSHHNACNNDLSFIGILATHQK